MSFCCGASMIGAISTLKHGQTLIHDVPTLYCLVCQKIEVHHAIRDEYEILADYAHSDHAPEVFFSDYVEVQDVQDLFANCINMEEHSTAELLKSQIDHSLDLLSIAKKMSDHAWQEQLFQRLKVLSDRQKRYQKNKARS